MNVSCTYLPAEEGTEATPLVIDIDKTGSSPQQFDVEDELVHLSASFSDACKFEVKLEAKQEVHIESCEASFSPIDGFDKVLLNGYQSWTDTAPVDKLAVMKGVNNIPPALLERYVLDGSGDYRFTTYEAVPGYIHGWTFGYFLAPTSCQFIGSLDETKGFTSIRYIEPENKIIVSRETPIRTIDVGQQVTLLSIALLTVCADDNDNTTEAQESLIEQTFDAWVRQAKYKARPIDPLVGYTSWYSHYDDISESKMLSDLDSVSEALKQVDTAGFERVFQIDDGYCRVGDWLTVDEKKFPQGLKPIADRAKEASFTPGIWMAPFVCEKNSQLFADHSDWLLRDAENNLVRTGSHWSGGYALDTLNEDVREYVTSCIKTVVDEWGFQMLKLDFLYAACMVPHAGLNRGELMADACQLLRQAMGEDVLFDACGVPLASVFGIADFCRVGCDVATTWDANIIIRNTDREHVSTRNSLTNTIFRSPLDGRVLHNDPDVIFLGPQTKMTKEQQRMLLFGDACHASMLLTSDDMSTWSSQDFSLFQEAISLMRLRAAR